MEQVLPGQMLCDRIAPFYPNLGKSRPPIGLERMLRVHTLQQWFDLSDPGVEEMLYDSAAMRRFAGIDLGREPVPDETTICKFRHLPEQNDLGRQVFEQVHVHLDDRGVRIAIGTSVDATILHAPSSTKNRAVIREHAPRAWDFTNRRCRHRGVVDEAGKARNRTKSKVRARIEHCFGAIKRVFGYPKERYRGLGKNAHRLFVTRVLANLFIVRKRLLRA